MGSIQTTGFCVQIASVLLYAVDRVHLKSSPGSLDRDHPRGVRIPQPMLDTQSHPAESTVWITRNHHSTSATAEFRAHRSRARSMLRELGKVTKVNIEGCWRLQQHIFECSMIAELAGEVYVGWIKKVQGVRPSNIFLSRKRRVPHVMSSTARTSDRRRRRTITPPASPPSPSPNPSHPKADVTRAPAG